MFSLANDFLLITGNSMKTQTQQHLITSFLKVHYKYNKICM